MLGLAVGVKARLRVGVGLLASSELVGLAAGVRERRWRQEAAALALGSGVGLATVGWHGCWR